MEPSNIKKKLTEIFQDVFDDPSLEISDKTTANDIEDWDSLTHIRLIIAVEKKFGVNFITKDIKSLENVGDFINLISKKLD